MKQQRRPALIAGMVLIVGLGCQIAGLFSSEPMPLPPIQPSPVRITLPAPTLPQDAAPTVAQPPLVVASPTLPSATQPTQPPPPQSSTCTNPNAAIISPTMDSTVSGLIEIRGTATRPDMQYWKVEYRADTSTNYTGLNNSDKAVTDGVLARWSTKTVPNGVYHIRLVLVQKDGNFGTPCEIRVTISN